MSKYLVFVLFLGLLIFGCLTVSDVKCQIVFLNQHGAGHAQVIFHSSSDLTDDLPTYFGDRDNVKYRKSGDVYYVDFDLTVNDITDFSRFTASTSRDVRNITTYTYRDKLSFNLLTGEDISMPDFDYCVQMPDDSKITYLKFDGFEYPDAVGENNYCVEIDGSSSNYGQDLTIISVYEPTGCSYRNPPCSSDYHCIDNVCVKKEGCLYNNPRCGFSYICAENNTCILRSGCAYNNPPCDTNETCQNNVCVLKSGCQYDNPSCDENHRCIDNVCIRKEGCYYDNPICDENHTCINNICSLKKGCQYNNPSCEWYGSCYQNECGINPSIIAGVIFVLVVIALIIKKRYM